MVGCTIMGNDSSNGGGIVNLGVLSLFNCTVSENSGLYGSGIDNGRGYTQAYPNATIYVDHCTVAFNTNSS